MAALPELSVINTHMDNSPPVFVPDMIKPSFTEAVNRLIFTLQDHYCYHEQLRTSITQIINTFRTESRFGFDKSQSRILSRIIAIVHENPHRPDLGKIQKVMGY